MYDVRFAREYGPRRPVVGEVTDKFLACGILAPVPHRQVVLTIPKRLRAYCLYRRCLLGEIARVATRTVTAAIRTVTGEQDLAVGIVACVQTHDTGRVSEAFRRTVLRFRVRLDLFELNFPSREAADSVTRRFSVRFSVTVATAS